MISPTRQFQSGSISRFLRDASSFVASSRAAIERSAPHIYISALPFAAQDGLVYQTFFPLCAGIISLTATYGIDRPGGQLSMTLTGHERVATSATYSPDGLTVASSSFDGTVRIWDIVTSNEAMAPLRSNDGIIYSVAFAPNGIQIASGAPSGIVYVWTLLNNETTLQRLPGHTSVVLSVAFSSDGSVLASASGDETVRLWSAETWDLRCVLRGHTDRVSAVVFSPDKSSCSIWVRRHEHPIMAHCNR